MQLIAASFSAVEQGREAKDSRLFPGEEGHRRYVVCPPAAPEGYNFVPQTSKMKSKNFPPLHFQMRTRKGLKI
jgi:hypothetical protein